MAFNGWPVNCLGCGFHVGQVQVQSTLEESVVVPATGAILGVGFQSGKPHLVCPNCGTATPAQNPLTQPGPVVFIEKTIRTAPPIRLDREGTDLDRSFT